MADINPSVALGITPPDPNQGLNTLSKVMGLGQQGLAIRGQQSQNQSLAAKATVDTQTATENQNLARLVSDPVNSGIIDNDGNETPDAKRIILQAAPTTGADHYEKLVAASQKKLDFNKSVNSLRSDERTEFANTVGGAAAGAQSPDDVKTAINALVASKKGSAVEGDYQNLADTTNGILDHVTKRTSGNVYKIGEEPWRQAALGVQRQVLGAPQVVGAGGIASGTPGTINNGKTIQPIVQAPSLFGGSITMAPGAIENKIPPGYIMGSNGQWVRASEAGISPANVKQPPGLPGAPGAAAQSQSKLQPIQRPGINAPRADQDRYNAQIAAGAQHVQDVSAAANDLQNGVGPTRYRNDQIQDILNSKTFSPTGPGAAQLNWISSKVPGQSGDAFQKIGHYLAQNSAAIAQKMGVPNTNMGAENAAAAAGNTSQNRGALLEITKVNDAMNSGLDLYNRGLAKITNNGSDPTKVAAYRQAFGQNFDINVLRYDDALRRNDRAEIDSLSKKLGPKGMQALGAKRGTLHSLSDTGDLP